MKYHHNKDEATVAGFGDEWTRFDQSKLDVVERQSIFARYFAVFPWSLLSDHAIGLDIGCGSGRWATLVAPRVGTLHCIDASAEALAVAQHNLEHQTNCVFHHASVDHIPLPDNYADFGYSLGVLHHVPDTAEGIRQCVTKLKRGAPLLVYLYYAFDNRPWWFRHIWRVSNLLRLIISRLPCSLRYGVSQILAGLIYFPLARSALLAEKLGMRVDHFPLAGYRHRSFYVMRNDALDRFGTQLEQRFTRQQITAMMHQAGLERITFSESMPFWCAVGYKA